VRLPIHWPQPLTHVGRFLARWPRSLRAARYVVRLNGLMARQLVRDDCLIKAGSLSFTTILSLVPILAVSLLIFRVSGAFAAVEQSVRDYLLQTFLAESVNEVVAYLNEFLYRVGSSAIGVAGLLFLIFSSIWFFIEMESDVNAIWRITRRRPFMARFVIFWSLLTLGPLVLGLLLWVGSELKRHTGGVEWPIALAGAVVPYAIASLGLTIAYKLLPFALVRWRAALSGGLLAGLLFEVLRFGFNLYVTMFYHGSATMKIYGAFGLFPVFLLWIYLWWLVFLFGAEASYTVQNLDALYDEHLRSRIPKELEVGFTSPYLTCRVAYLVAYRYGHGAGPVRRRDLMRALRTREEVLDETVRRLVAGEVFIGLHVDGEPAYLPARDLTKITLEDVLRAHHAVEPLPESFPPLPTPPALESLFGAITTHRSSEAAKHTLGELITGVDTSALDALFAPTVTGQITIMGVKPRPSGNPVPPSPKRPEHV
jgi:membrane protein